MAANSTSSGVDDAMDRLWFYKSNLFFEPHVVRLQSMLTRPKTIDNRSQHKCSDEDPKLNIIISQQLFQLQPPRLEGPQPRSKRKQRVKRQRSLSDLEKYELKGFIDLGFTFPRDKPSAYIMSIVPGLHRLMEKDEEQDDDDERQVKRPYLSEAWLINSPDTPLPNLRMLPKGSDGAADMKEHLKFWAKRVAILVHEDHD